MAELPLQFRRAWTHNDESFIFLAREEPDWLALWQVREHLVDRALNAARERGTSYRNFKVGTAAFLTSERPELLRQLRRPTHIIFTGSNWKQGPEERNTCAEQEIVSQIRQLRHLHYPKEVLALVVAGDCLQEPDRVSGVNPNYLHPCSHCRKLLSAIPQVTENTLIISVNLENTKKRIWTFEEILKIHQPNRRSPS